MIEVGHIIAGPGKDFEAKSPPKRDIIVKVKG
jgi:hypothetical protein